MYIGFNGKMTPLFGDTVLWIQYLDRLGSFLRLHLLTQAPADPSSCGGFGLDSDFPPAVLKTCHLPTPLAKQA